MLIQSLLDTDFYKVTMANIVYSRFRDANVTYGFKCRSKDIDLTKFIDLITTNINNLYYLNFKSEELNYLKKFQFLDSDFIDYLKDFKLDPTNQVSITTKGRELSIEIKGKWIDTIWYEIPVLAIVNQLYFEQTSDQDYAFSVGLNKLYEKIEIAKREPFTFADFGTRRRYSQQWQEKVVKILSSHSDIDFTGTSNVHLAMKYNLRPIGTMAHEYLQGCQALAPSIQHAHKFALENWIDQYQRNLGIALTDIFGLDYFLKDFDRNLAKRYIGVRHDSGDPFIFAKKMLDHYQQLGIDPKTKTLVFSDGLNFEKVKDLYQEFNNQINVVFGVGTNLTNDCGYKPLSIVMKMITCNDRPTIKLSDSPGKMMCRDADYVEQIKKMIKSRLEK